MHEGDVGQAAVRLAGGGELALVETQEVGRTNGNVEIEIVVQGDGMEGVEVADFLAAGAEAEVIS